MTYFANDDRQGKHQSLRLLEWLNFFLADVQTGLGPFLAAYLARAVGIQAAWVIALRFGRG